jgi:hypothetical protein
VGIKIGSFVYFPELTVDGLATNNVLLSPAKSPDVAAEVGQQSRLVSNWSTHALELRATSLLSFHDDFASEDDRAWAVEGRGRLDVTRQTNFEALASHDFHQESRSDINAPRTGERPNVTTDVGALALNHRFNRLRVQLRGSATEYGYSDTVNGSVVENNSDRNETITEQAIRASWEFKPTFSIFSEVGVNQRAFEVPTFTDGIPRNSDGERVRFGIDFGSTGQVLRGEASLGWGLQTPHDPRLIDIEGLLFDANLAWRATELTSFLLTARTDIYDTTTADSPGVLTHYVGLEARHAFRSYLIATAGLAYTDYDYAAVPQHDRELRATLGTEYYANRDLILFGRYDHIDYNSNVPANAYVADDIRIGVRIRR